MNVLSVCSGIGGIELGLKLAVPSARTVGYVEGEAYAASVLVARMEEGLLDEAPIHADAQTFSARAWRGSVDCVASGFPCQPFSVAGAQQAENDPRHLWPHIARIVSECDPALVFLENVAIRAFVEPWRDLRSMGFNLSRPFACTAAELGATHIRCRIFALAYRPGIRLESWRLRGESGAYPSFALEPRDQEPPIPRMDDGDETRLDRNRALGNSVSPEQAAFAFRTLMQEIV